MYFELHNTTIFDKLRKNNFIFYTFINSNDDLQNLIYIFNMFCNMNNYTNIILHITFTQFNIIYSSKHEVGLCQEMPLDGTQLTAHNKI